MTPLLPELPEADLPGRDALLSALSHELGNLLAAIRLSAHLLASAEGGDRERMAGEVERMAARGGALLAHLRPLRRDPADCETLPVPAAQILDGLVQALADGAPGALSLETSLEGLPPVLVDPEAVHRVLVSLALSALSSLGPAMSMELGTRREETALVLMLSDAGPALDLVELERPAPRSSRELALRLADAVLRRFGGHLAVGSGAEGSLTEVWLPLAGGDPRMP